MHKILLFGLMVGFGAQSAFAACPDAPEPVLTLDFASRYEGSDATRSTLNKANADAAKAALKPLDGFVSDLAKDLAQALTETDAAQQRAAADCILQRMAAWARADALSDLESRSVNLTIGARLAAFGIMAHRAARHAQDTAALAQVSDWLALRVGEQMTFWETAPDGASRGNLRSWAALAAAASAALSDDPITRGWAAWSTKYVLCTANEDGSLPQEMSRGRLALHYQVHAIAPLVTTALLLERQDLPVRDLCGGALARAVAFTLADMEDGRLSAGITGVVQSYFDGSDTFDPFQMAWLVPWYHLSGDPEIADRIATFDTLSYSKLGGDQSLIWAQ